MPTRSPTPTHKSVQEYYGRIARGSGSCCQPEDNLTGSCPSDPAATGRLQNNLYPVDLLNTLPAEVANFTAGSGDPINLARLQPGETVLDLGSGGGLDCFLAAKKVGASGHVIGVDMTPEMLARARSTAEQLKVRNVEFREGYLEDLPVEAASIDVVISNCVINLSPDKPQVFREIQRVLKPGGRLAVSDPVANHPLPDKNQGSPEDWCGCVSGALEINVYQDELRKAGFVDISIEADLDGIEKAIENGQAQIQGTRSKEEVLADLRSFTYIKKTLVIPHKITARKPGKAGSDPI